MQTPFNLLDESWLPIRRRDGAAETIRPSEITSDIDSNPIVAIDWPRADFRVAAIEFLIGLIATACPPPPGDDEAWLDGWEAPPGPEALARSFAPLLSAFDLDGPGPRFLQDLDELPGDPESPETLLIEAPGENTLENNRALFVKPDRITRLARPAAAMALFTLQCYAPQGGRGYRTSVRGGGPLTTLAMPGLDPCPLWHLVWANVPNGKAAGAADLPRVFPWLAPTRTADRFPATTPLEAHPLQAFWGMPWRVRLELAENADRLPCDVTGIVDDIVVIRWRKKDNGVKYVGWARVHPLSPISKDTHGGGWHSRLAKAGIGYRDWVAIALGDAPGTSFPARSVSAWKTRKPKSASHASVESRLLAAGYNFVNNRKAYAFVESEMPLPGTDPASAEAFACVARHLVAAAEIAARSLRLSVRDACFERDTKPDAASLAVVYESFWRATGEPFFTLLRQAGASDPDAGLTRVARGWQEVLRAAALRLFDQAAPLDPAAASFDPRKIVRARLNLVRTLSGYGAQGIAFFGQLGLPEPEPAKRGGRRRNARGTA